MRNNTRKMCKFLLYGDEILWIASKSLVKSVKYMSLRETGSSDVGHNTCPAMNTTPHITVTIRVN